MFRKESFTNRKVFVRFVIHISVSEINVNVLEKLDFFIHRLWVHEAMRVFYDRLIEDKDREWLFNEIRLCVNNNFQETFDVVFNNLSDSAVRICKYVLHVLIDDETIT